VLNAVSAGRCGRATVRPADPTRQQAEKRRQMHGKDSKLVLGAGGLTGSRIAAGGLPE
jgi:hypothetical protein